MRINKETLIKIIILLCMIFFFGRMTSSGELLTFVHPRIIPFVKFSIFLMVIICIFLVLNINKYNDNIKNNIKSYRVFLIPLIFVLLLQPSIDLQNIKANKNTSTNTSLNDSKANNNNESINNKVSNTNDNNIIEVNNENYISKLDDLSSNIDKYDGKRIELTGFVYKDDTVTGKNFVCARYLMVCCAADMQVVGILCKDESSKVYKSNSWIKVKGTLKKCNDDNAIDVMYIEVDSSEEIDTPKEQYVYHK